LRCFILSKFLVVCEWDPSELGQLGDVIIDHHSDLEVCLRTKSNLSHLDFQADKHCGLILMGGGDYSKSDSTKVKDEKIKIEIGWIEAALSNQVPVLGICYGAQLLSIQRSGLDYWNLKQLKNQDRGLKRLNLTDFGKTDYLLGHIGDRQALMCHWHDYGIRVSDRDVLLATSQNDDGHH
jgi:GMP synthase-like glutamine amidotransferase